LNPRPGPDLESVRRTLREEEDKMDPVGRRRPRRWLRRATGRFRRGRRTDQGPTAGR